MLGLKLDSGDGRSGAGGSVDVMPYNSAGQPEDDYSKVGGAVKARFMDTVIKAGDVFLSAPSFNTATRDSCPKASAVSPWPTTVLKAWPCKVAACIQ